MNNEERTRLLFAAIGSAVRRDGISTVQKRVYLLNISAGASILASQNQLTERSAARIQTIARYEAEKLNR